MFYDKSLENISYTVPLGGSKFGLCTGREVGVVTRLHGGHPRNSGSITGRGNSYIPKPKSPDRLLECTHIRTQLVQFGFSLGAGSGRSRKLTHSIWPVN
jgi:hypothetical protein